MTATPTNPGSLYVLDWENYADCAEPAQVPGWRKDYASNVSHPNNQPAFRTSCTGEPVRSGQRSARFQLNKGDPVVSSGARAELEANPCCEPLNAERWYGFSIYLPDDWAPDQSAESLTQWHQANVPDPRFGGSPPLAILTHAGQWEISVRKASWDNTIDQDTNNILISPYETGKWTDWVVHVKWSAGPNGVLEIWKNGQLVHNAQGQNKFNDGQGNYMKFGIYKWAWSQNKPSDTTQRIMFYDELRIADEQGSYETVAPGSSGSQEGSAMRIGAGNTPKGQTNWQDYIVNGTRNGIYVDVDTSAARFSSTPIYVSSIEGNAWHWETTGGSAIYSPKATGFRVYVRWSSKDIGPNPPTPPDPQFANNNGWRINWIGWEP